MSTPESIATRSSSDCRVSMLTGTSRFSCRRLTMSGIRDAMFSPATIPISTMFAPDLTKYWARFKSSSWLKMGALAISASTLMGKSSPTGRSPTRMFSGFLRSFLMFSWSFSKSAMYFRALFLCSSSMSLSADFLEDKSSLSTISRTMSRSAASVDPL